MPTLTIDDRTVTVPPGTTILEAARTHGIRIPALCWREGFPPHVSCMLCIVQVEGLNRFVPSCATPVEEGMKVRTDTPAIRQDRRLTLELLLSHHTGDCEAPCALACPAGLDIPAMLRWIAGNRVDLAARLAAEALVLPRTLGAICPAPCEKVCRRNAHDGALAIPALHRAVAGGLASDRLLDAASASGRQIAVVGAGPAGIAAAVAARSLGHGVRLLEAQDRAGGQLRAAIAAGRLAESDLDADLELLDHLGVVLVSGTPLRDREHLEALRAESDAVVLATGGESDVGKWGLETGPQGIVTDRVTGATSLLGVFAAGAVVRPIRRMAVRAVAAGRAAAQAADRFLRQGPPQPASPRPIRVSMGTLREGELQRFLETAAPEGRHPGADERRVPPGREAAIEAFRCLHCDCRARTDCRLREYATEYGANPSRWKDRRPPFEQDFSHPDIVYEPAKCIACGLCIRVSERAGERLGTTFLGRGIAVRVGAPLRQTLAAALTVSAAECVAVCPTGALAFRTDPD